MHIEKITFEWNKDNYRSQRSAIIRIFLSEPVKQWTTILLLINLPGSVMKARAQIEPNNDKSFIGIPYIPQSLAGFDYNTEYEGKSYNGELIFIS